MSLFSAWNVEDVRKEFCALKTMQQFVIDKSGCKLLEIVGATFIADEPTIFGEVNHAYVERELEWYKSMSLNVNDIKGKVPAAWKAVATPDGRINSNYGWMIWSRDNHDQYLNVMNELRSNPSSRRAQMIYTRPTMWEDHKRDGMNDFVCTNAVQFFNRDNQLDCVVEMRSNDVVFGYRNDYAWHRFVLEQLAADLCLAPGKIVWHAGSLHVYQRHFDLVK